MPVNKEGTFDSVLINIFSYQLPRFTGLFHVSVIVLLDVFLNELSIVELKLYTSCTYCKVSPVTSKPLVAIYLMVHLPYKFSFNIVKLIGLIVEFITAPPVALIMIYGLAQLITSNSTPSTIPL